MFAIAHWTPAITPASVPEPAALSTLIPTRAAPGATPGSPLPTPVPAIVAATCVPCPWSSNAVAPTQVALTQLTNASTLPPLRSLWVASMPVSMTAATRSLLE